MSSKNERMIYDKGWGLCAVPIRNYVICALTLQYRHKKTAQLGITSVEGLFMKCSEGDIG